MLSLLLLMTTAQDPPKPIGPLPSENQVAWHKRQYYAFVHFGPNTFTGNEWGLGTEDPNVFNPTSLDCRQWCKAFKEVGMTGVIITAKHHDGFALWPSRYTDHSVKASKWRDGKGDVLEELSEACREYDLWLGVYLSPWDRNHPTYGNDAYNDTFVAMLTEVLTKYGEIKEVWFDGANGEGPNGKRQIYDWNRYISTVRDLAPGAVIFHDGGDVRWVGNEQGFVGETNWNFLPSGHWPGDTSIYDRLFSGDAEGDTYSPGECDVSIRPGWFWRASEDSRVKSLSQLKDIWYRSVGHGGNLLLNVPPNDKGLISAEDVAALMEFKKWRDESFSIDLAAGAVPSASSGLAKTDKNYKTYRAEHAFWIAQEPSNSGEFALTWKGLQMFDHVVLREKIELGQRAKAFRVEADGNTIARGTTIGYERTVRFSAVSASKLRVVIEDARAAPTLASVQVYLGLPSVTIVSGEPAFMGSQQIALESDNPKATIHYTLDGSDPTEDAPKYVGPLTLSNSALLRAAAYYGHRRSSETVQRMFTAYTANDLWHSTVFVRQPDPGVRYAYYEQGLQTLEQLRGAKAVGSGVSGTGLDLSLRKRDEHFGFVFEGVISASQDGVYKFFLTSDDGSRLYVDGRRVIDNDGLHGMATKDGIAPMQKGYHQIRVEYFNASGGLGLGLEWRGPSFARRLFTPADFRH